jgi:ubiquinone/menaquinone biosynthesis C-methylase UbiE
VASRATGSHTSVDAEAIRREAQAQWGQDPAGGLAAGDEPLGTPASFARVERYRYEEQPWMHDTFRFEQYEGQRLLEVGVGLGTDHLQFARAGARTTGIDLTPRCVELTRLRLQQEGLEPDVHQMDAERLAFADHSFDAVFSFGVLHHVPSMEAAFAEIRRVLRPGGAFVGALYNRRSIFTARVRVEWLLSGGAQTEPWSRRLSRIEYSTSDAEPYVRLMTTEQLTRALNEAGFADVRIRKRHSALGSITYRMPGIVERALGAVGGWYLIHEAR